MILIKLTPEQFKNSTSWDTPFQIYKAVNQNGKINHTNINTLRLELPRVPTPGITYKLIATIETGTVYVDANNYLANTRLIPIRYPDGKYRLLNLDYNYIKPTASLRPVKGKISRDLKHGVTKMGNMFLYPEIYSRSGEYNYKVIEGTKIGPLTAIQWLALLEANPHDQDYFIMRLKEEIANLHIWGDITTDISILIKWIISNIYTTIIL